MAFTIPEDISEDQLIALRDYFDTAQEAGHEPDDECETCIEAKAEILNLHDHEED
jgi:hypothetical protein